MKRRRSHRSRKLLFATLAAAAAAGVASATPLGAIANAQIASNVPACDTHGFTVAYSVSGSTIGSVTVGSIPLANCDGATLAVTITDANGNTVAGTQPGTVASDELTLALDTRVALAGAAGVEISVVG